MSAVSAMTLPILEVEHLSMKFGGLVAIGDLSFEAKRGEITALIGPNGAGKTTVFNCITGFYKPSEGMITLTSRDGKQFLLERLPDFQIPAMAKVARTFQNIRLFSGMTLLENLLVAQHNKLMRASGFTVLGLFGFSGYRRASAESIELAKHWLEKAEPDRPRRRPGRRPALWRAAPAGDRARHVHRAGAAVPRRAGGRPQPEGIAGAERAAQRHQGDDRHLDPADRARHVGGDADFRPRRRAGIRPQDLRRRPDLGEERPARHRRLSRRRRHRGHRRAGGGRRRAGDRATRRRAGPGAWAVGFVLDDGRAGFRHGRPQRRERRDRQGFEECLQGRAVRPSRDGRALQCASPRRAAARRTSSR